MSDAALAPLTDAKVLYLTTAGRQSGQPRTIKIWFTCYQDKLYLNAERAYKAHWVINVIQNPAIAPEIRLG